MSVRFGVRVVRFEATDLIVDCRLNEKRVAGPLRVIGRRSQRLSPFFPKPIDYESPDVVSCFWIDFSVFIRSRLLGSFPLGAPAAVLDEPTIMAKRLVTTEWS